VTGGDGYRLVPVTEPGLQPGQRAAWDSLAGGKRGAKSVRAEGFLTGPFDVLLRSPGVAQAGGRLGEVLRFETELTQRERELAIITVAARWQAGPAWVPHAAYAAEAGLAPEVIAGIAAGREPGFDSDRDRVIYQLVRELVAEGQLSDERYAAALALLGERRLVELVALSGYYCFTSVVLNAFRVPPPAGTSVPWNPKEAPAHG
jgi:4-carboxymuconolactone decarboxylase